jgi:hypothetical protein
VLENGEKLGEIGVTRVYHRSHGVEYTTQSWRVTKTRGSRETKQTKKLDVALRNCKKYLVFKKLDEWFTTEEPVIQTGYKRALSDLKNDIAYGHQLTNKGTVIMQQYLFCIANNRDIPPQLEQELLPLFRKPNYERAMSEYELANHMENKKTLAIIKVGDDYLFKDEFDVCVKLPFEQLPISMQEKLAVLQLMESNEVVRDVGFKHEKEGNFLITID